MGCFEPVGAIQICIKRLKKKKKSSWQLVEQVSMRGYKKELQT
jgi:hypothetical protein